MKQNLCDTCNHRHMYLSTCNNRFNRVINYGTISKDGIVVTKCKSYSVDDKNRIVTEIVEKG